MAAMTYSDCWRTVRLYCPSAPTFLVREWVQTAWKQLLQRRRWGFLRAETTLSVLTSTEYLTMPADFASFKVVVDEAREVKISIFRSLDDLACLDPGRMSSGEPRALVAATPSTDALTLGRARYEVHPRGGSATLTAVYHRQAPRLVDTDSFTGVLADSGEVLVSGALAQAALWPGTGDRPNPYFNAGLAQMKKQEFEQGVQLLSLRDDEQYPDDYWDSWPDACCDTSLTGSYRASDRSAGDLF